MGLFWRVSASDRDHVLLAVRSLHASSVAGVAAALSWSERRTERVLSEVASRNPHRVSYNRSAGQVRWLDPTPPPAPAASPPPTRIARSLGITPAPTPLPETPVKWGSENRCPSCHVPLAPTGTPGVWFCSHCGKLSGTPGASHAARPPPESTRLIEPNHAPSDLTDRRGQEMLAAWVTSQPIPCPKCRTALRHRGVGEYACPSCGQHVRFPQNGGLLPTAPSPPGAA